jgi:hypothetical protein
MRLAEPSISEFKAINPPGQNQHNRIGFFQGGVITCGLILALCQD